MCMFVGSFELDKLKNGSSIKNHIRINQHTLFAEFQIKIGSKTIYLLAKDNCSVFVLITIFTLEDGCYECDTCEFQVKERDAVYWIQQFVNDGLEQIVASL